MKRLALSSIAVLAFCGALSAQEMQRFTAAIGGGFTTPVGRAGQDLDNGWNIMGGAGINFNPYVGAMVDVGYNSMGVNSAVLGGLGYAGGGMHILSATLDPIVHLNPRGHVDFYLTGGGGIYHRYQDF